MPRDASAAVQAVLGKGGDDTVLEYLCGVLEDEDFELGENGQLAYEDIGPMLVNSLHQRSLVL